MQRFADNVDLSKVTHFSCALGDENCEILMSGGQHRLHPDYVYKTLCLRLDEFNLEDVAFLKIDVEGYEKKVLLGAHRLLQRCNPIIVIEQNDVVLQGDDHFSARNHLENLGYRVIATCSRGWDHIMMR